MTELYPLVEPHAHGDLDVGDGQRIHWEECGNPHGKPAVVLHGGPGSGCIPGYRRSFDPAAYRVVLLDQRGAGRSTPHASTPGVDLSTNTTRHLIADLEALRTHLGIERWLVFGMSWGSTLGVAYAEAHADRVSEIVLRSVTLTRRADVEWFTRGVGRFFPDEWVRFRDGVPASERDGDLAAAYARLLAHDDPKVRESAARRWCEWEEAVVSLETGWRPNPRYRDPDFRLAFARLVTHYFSNAAFLDDDQLVRWADRLAGIAGVAVHGRLDLGGPLVVARELAAVWSDLDLQVLPGGHIGNKKVVSALVDATDRFATP